MHSEISLVTYGWPVHSEDSDYCLMGIGRQSFLVSMGGQSILI